MSTDRTSILFVCMGNICRSPTAECVFRAIVEREGLGDRFAIDSAGTGSWHVGDKPDRRMRAAGRNLGWAIDGAARQVSGDDFDHHDLILCMDDVNLGELLAMGAPADRTHLFLEFVEMDTEREVPDPYYGGEDGFEHVVTLVARASERLIERIK